ncbi:hypothetical protein [Paraliobacillus sediminis]|nr:hypothetical protein [Paraliobacillus sediminis]
METAQVDLRLCPRKANQYTDVAGESLLLRQRFSHVGQMEFR